MKKDKNKLSFEVDRFKVIKMLAKNCESAEEYNEMMKIIDGTDEVVREDASLESTHCLLILDRLLHNILTLSSVFALRKRKLNWILLERMKRKPKRLPAPSRLLAKRQRASSTILRSWLRKRRRASNGRSIKVRKPV